MGTSMASPHAAGVAALIVGAGVTQARRRRGDPARHRAQAQGRAQTRRGRGSTTTTAPASSTRRRPCTKARDGRGAGELGAGGLRSRLRASSMRRRGVALEKLGLGFGPRCWRVRRGCPSCRLLPLRGPRARRRRRRSRPASRTLPAALGALGSPLFYSAALPLALTVLLYGVTRAAPGAGGLRLWRRGRAAVRGALRHRRRPLRPRLLDRIWLATNAAVAALFAAAVLRKRWRNRQAPVSSGRASPVGARAAEARARRGAAASCRA